MQLGSLPTINIYVYEYFMSNTSITIELTYFYLYFCIYKYLIYYYRLLTFCHITVHKNNKILQIFRNNIVI